MEKLISWRTTCNIYTDSVANIFLMQHHSRAHAYLNFLSKVLRWTVFKPGHLLITKKVFLLLQKSRKSDYRKHDF